MFHRLLSGLTEDTTGLESRVLAASGKRGSGGPPSAFSVTTSGEIWVPLPLGRAGRVWCGWDGAEDFLCVCLEYSGYCLKVFCMARPPVSGCLVKEAGFSLSSL